MVRAVVRFCYVLVLSMSWLAHDFAEAHGPAAGPVGPRVRGATPQMTRLIHEGVKRSRTFSSLVSALNQTDVIVYVQERRDLPVGVDGQLTLATAANAQRYLRAQVLSGLGTSETIAIVAHELQHAVEIAQHTDVRDAEALAALYRRIGITAHHGRYDTAAAQAAGSRVRAELG